VVLALKLPAEERLLRSMGRREGSNTLPRVLITEHCDSGRLDLEWGLSSELRVNVVCGSVEPARRGAVPEVDGTP